jgi:hypothetical protein
MTTRVDSQASLSRPRNDRAIGAQAHGGVSYRVGIAVLASLAWVLAIGLLERISPSAREASADAPSFYGP